MYIYICKTNTTRVLVIRRQRKKCSSKTGVGNKTVHVRCKGNRCNLVSVLKVAQESASGSTPAAFQHSMVLLVISPMWPHKVSETRGCQSYSRQKAKSVEVDRSKHQTWLETQHLYFFKQDEFADRQRLTTLNPKQLRRQRGHPASKTDMVWKTLIVNKSPRAGGVDVHVCTHVLTASNCIHSI